MQIASLRISRRAARGSDAPIPTERPSLECVPPLSLYAAETDAPGSGPRAVCLIVPSCDAGAAPFGADAEMRAYRALARRLQIAGVATLLMERSGHDDADESRRRHATAEPSGAGAGAGRRRPEAIVEHHKRILALFCSATQLFPELPSVVVARAEGALSAYALLRVDRSTTRCVSAFVAWEAPLAVDTPRSARGARGLRVSYLDTRAGALAPDANGDLLYEQVAAHLSSFRAKTSP